MIANLSFPFFSAQLAVLVVAEAAGSIVGSWGQKRGKTGTESAERNCKCVGFRSKDHLMEVKDNKGNVGGHR